MASKWSQLEKQRFTSSTTENELIIEILFDEFFLHERVTVLVKCIYPKWLIKEGNR